MTRHEKNFRATMHVALLIGHAPARRDIAFYNRFLDKIPKNEWTSYANYYMAATIEWLTR